MQYILRKVCETRDKSYTFPCKKRFVPAFCFGRMDLLSKESLL